MRLLFFLIFISTPCFSQSDLESRFYTVFPVDSLIQGDWKLVKTYVNYKETALEKDTYLRMTKDSLIKINEQSKRFYNRDQFPNEYLYQLTQNGGIRNHQLEIFHKKGKKLSHYHLFDLSFRNLNELVLETEFDLEEQIGTTKIHITHIYERAPKTEAIKLFSKTWFFCIEDNLDFQKLQSIQTFTFFSDSAQIDSCAIGILSIQFKTYPDEVTFSVEKNSNKGFVAFFSNEQKVILDEGNHILFLFMGKHILAYHIENISEDQLVLRQDNELTLKLNTDKE